MCYEKVKYFLIGIVAIVVAGVIYANTYTIFIPITVITGFNAGYHQVEVGNDFSPNLIAVLNKYAVPYKVDNGKVYIRRVLAWDKEMVWNYTTKALNHRGIGTKENR